MKIKFYYIFQCAYLLPDKWIDLAGRSDGLAEVLVAAHGANLNDLVLCPLQVVEHQLHLRLLRPGPRPRHAGLRCGHC